MQMRGTKQFAEYKYNVNHILGPSKSPDLKPAEVDSHVEA